MSDVPRPFKPATLDFLISAVQLVEIVTAFDTHFLLAFFSFGLTKLGIGQP